MTCQACGVEVRVGDWPYCPHGRGANLVEGDDRFIGGLTLENLGHKPVTVYSRSELKRLMKERGVEPFVRHVTVPGTDKSPHTTRWDAADPYTLEQARLLLERVGQQKPSVKDERAEYFAAMGEPPLTGADVKKVAEKL